MHTIIYKQETYPKEYVYLRAILYRVGSDWFICDKVDSKELKLVTGVTFDMTVNEVAQFLCDESNFELMGVVS